MLGGRDSALGKGALVQQVFHVVPDAPLHHRPAASASQSATGRAGAAVAAFELEAEEAVRGLFLDVGGVAASTVRVKPGHRKSWALVSFHEPAQAQQAVSHGAVEVQLPPEAGAGGAGGGGGRFVSLRVRPATVRAHLRGGACNARLLLLPQLPRHMVSIKA
eukprot:COSAG03_NODE_210_length_10594_cov_32.990472_1_plen_162_part_00